MELYETTGIEPELATCTILLLQPLKAEPHSCKTNKQTKKPSIL